MQQVRGRKWPSVGVVEFDFERPGEVLHDLEDRQVDLVADIVPTGAVEFDAGGRLAG